MPVSTLQMKRRWESNINVWIPFMYSQKWNCYFQNRIVMFCLPVPTLIYLWEIYIFPGSVCLFCCREICGPIQEIYKSLTTHMNVQIGTEAAQFPEKEYINGIFLAVHFLPGGKSQRPLLADNAYKRQNHQKHTCVEQIYSWHGWAS